MFFNVVLAVMAVGVFVAVDAGDARAEGALASWYGEELAGSPTASGEAYDPYGYTAAHKTLPLGTELVVSYGGSSVQVTVNDRGPYVGDRALDLSQGAAQAIGLDQAGVDYVDYSYADPANAYAPEPAPTTTPEPITYDEPQPVYESESEHAPQTSYETGASGGAGASGGYVVQGGDTLTSLAAQLGTSVDDLAAANGISDPNYIQAGQTLVF